MMIQSKTLLPVTPGGLQVRTGWVAASVAAMFAMSGGYADTADEMLRSPLLEEPPPISFLLRNNLSATYDSLQLNGLPTIATAQHGGGSPIARMVLSTLKQRTGYDGQTAVSSENRDALFVKNEDGPKVGVSTSQLARLTGQMVDSPWDLTVRSALPSENAREIVEREYTIRYHFITLGVVTDAVQEMNTYRVRVEWRW